MDIKKPNDKYTNPLTGKLVFDSIKPLDLTNFTKDDLRAYFNNSYDLYETLFTSLKYDSVYYLCPDRLRLPLIFYYGHTAAVFMNKLCLSGLIKPNERIKFEFDTTFETGVDEMSWDDTEHYRMGGSYKWPTVEETKQYRAKVRELINKVIDRTPLELPVNWDSPWWVFFMGFEHERIHFETSTVLIRQYPIELVQRPIGWTYAPFKLSQDKAVLQNPMVKVEETQVRLGKSFDFPSYGWDNEYGQVDCKVSSFEASKFKITNEQYLEFVLDNGYQKREYWSEEGWEWVQFKQAKHPLFWVCPMKCKSGCGGVLSPYSHCQQHHFESEIIELFNNKEEMKKTCNIFDENQNPKLFTFPFKFRLMYDIVDMPKNWPVEVNYHEAKAYCKWKGEGYRVITEAEHHAIRDFDVLDLNTANDIIYKIHSKVNHNMAYGSSTPVDLHPANTKGFHDVFGNVWEWTEDNFNGLPGTKTHYLYDDFSSPCYDGRHNLIMGGSWASTGDEASCFARFMFRRHFYQHCGFRLVRSCPTTDDSIKPNPQVRLVKDHIFVLGAGVPNNKVDLDPSKLQLNFYDTTNQQYFHDSHLHPEIFDNEILEQHIEIKSQPIIDSINSILDKQIIENKIATHLGCSTGTIVFDLVKRFEEVIGVDYCGKFLDVALKLQSKGEANVILETKENKVINVKLDDLTNVNKAVFKQMTWIPNEIPKSDFVLFSMIDRVENHISWLKRMREIVKPNGILVFYSKESKWSSKNLTDLIGHIFDLQNELTINGKDTLNVWKMKSNYAIEYL